MAAGCVAVILSRSYNDPRSIKKEDETAKLWPAYQALITELPHLVQPDDAVIFTNRHFEFYLLDTDKSPAQRYVLAKATQPEILTTLPKLWQQNQSGRIWLVTDGLDNPLLVYATQGWLNRRGRPTQSYLFGDTVRLAAFEPDFSAPWPAIPPEPPLARLVKPDDYTFKGIAALLGWDWPGLTGGPAAAFRAGQTYPLELYWIFYGKSPQDHFRVRLLDREGQVITESLATPRPDNPPVRGQLQVEETSLNLPPHLLPGVYQLQIGLDTPNLEQGELIFPLPPQLTEIRLQP